MAAKTQKPVEIRALAGARAFPPLLIVLFHFSEGHHYSGNPWLDLLAARGYLWVEFFFALSGFILTHVYGARVAQLFSCPGFAAFMKARLTRLYPLHLFMLLALLALMTTARAFAHYGGYVSYYDSPYHADMHLKGFVLSLFLVHAWNTMNTLTWNGASWFVSVEFALCLLFPIFAWLGHGKVWRGLVLIAAGVAGLVLLDWTSLHGLDITYHNGVLRGLSDFSAGVGMAVLYRELKPRDTLPALAHSLIQAGLLVALFYAFYNSGWSHNFNDIWCVLPMLALVLALSFDRGLPAEALKSRIPQMMGVWSYAVYMGQTFWLQAIRVFEQRLYPAANSIVLGMRFSSLNWWLEPALLVLVCIAWGALLANYVEHPATNALKSAR
ncbi:MAG TPA: acyltransferase [Rhizomicrobium sp.]|nr:acyltransferase [Rhizomicrobium sp.]